jgi:hypothetical protein
LILKLSLDIVIPVRNGGEALAATLHALLASEDHDFRLLVSDNYSTDGNPWQFILDQFPSGQVVLLHPPEPLGRVEHWTWAARQADAPFCKLLLCGDRFPPDYLGKIRQAFALQPDLIYTTCLNLVFGNTLEEQLEKMTWPDVMTPLSGAAYRARNAVEFNLLGPLSAVTFRTASLRRALPFEPRYGWTADWRLYDRIMRTGTAVRCEATYCIQDRTIRRVSSTFRGVLPGIFEERAYHRELAGRPPLSLLGRWVEALPAVAAYIWRSLVPRAIRRGLGAPFRKLGLHRARATR